MIHNRQQSDGEQGLIANHPTEARHRQLIVGIAAAGIVISLLILQTLRWQEARLIREEFKQRSTDRIKTISSQFEIGIMLGRLGAASMRSSLDVTRSQFRVLVEPLLSQAGPIHAISWNRRVPASELATYITAAKSRFPDYEVRKLQADGSVRSIDPGSHELDDSEDFFIVAAIEPYEPNRTALGLDIASEPVRREAVDRACETGNSTATGRIRLVQEVGTQFGTLVISPVYRDIVQSDASEHQRENAVGVFVCVYRIGDVVEAAMKNLEPAGVHVHLFDESALPGQQLLYLHSSRLNLNPIEAIQFPDTLKEQGICEWISFDFGGRNWGLYCTPNADYFASRRTWLPITVFGLGVFITFLVVLYTFSQNRLHNQLRNEIVVRAEAEAHLRESERRFRHVARLSTMGEMVAGIAHELNQPLAAIANYSAAASNFRKKNSRLEEAEPVEEWLSQTRAQAMRCGDIIRRLRGFVMKEKLNWELVDLNHVVRDSIALIANDRRQFASIIECDLPDSVPKILASEVQLQQVLVNLLLNACDSTRDTENPCIRVSIALVDDGVRLTVEDNGSGIDEQQRASLFDSFFTTKATGMGMGLAISRSIIETHNGKLWLASETGSGTRFHVQLPIPSDEHGDGSNAE